MNAQEKLDKALELLCDGNYNQAYVLAKEVELGRFHSRREPSYATDEQASDAIRILMWTFQAARAAG